MGRDDSSFREPMSHRRPLLLLAVVSEGGLGGLALLLGWLLDHPPLVTWRWSFHHAAAGALASLPLLLLFAACLSIPLGPLLRIKRLAVRFIKPLFAPCTLFDLALISLLAGFGEEMLFRGVLQAVLDDHLGVWPGVIAASVAFGLLHLLTPTYGLLATMMGVYLGAVWLLTDNLLVAVTAHAVYDFIALVFLVRGLAPEPFSGI